MRKNGIVRRHEVVLPKEAILRRRRLKLQLYPEGFYFLFLKQDSGRKRDTGIVFGRWGFRRWADGSSGAGAVEDADFEEFVVVEFGRSEGEAKGFASGRNVVGMVFDDNDPVRYCEVRY